MYGNVTSLEHKKALNENYDPFLNGFRDEKNTGLVVNIQSLMLYSISIRVRLRVRNRTFDHRPVSRIDATFVNEGVKFSNIIKILLLHVNMCFRVYILRKNRFWSLIISLIIIFFIGM